ncbi:type II secretion system F family protein [Anaerovorax odorimutans]|uniref:type II secretion system F family protein n=1 Tax=Anaerovorax odorimutans TaxID=109327 RepID=UPI0003FC724C|nr:type II secretion system F family protein [Anaerovorax odorimutans]
MLIYFITFFTTIFIYFLILSIAKPSSKKLINNRITKYFHNDSISEIQDQVFKEKLEIYKKKKSNKFKIASKEFSDYLAMSGIKLRASEFIYVWISTTFLPIIIISFSNANIITAMGLSIIGFIIPPLLVQRGRKKRQTEFNKQLGESLVVMSNCIKAGFTFQQAMESISNDMQPPISTEFGNALREMRFGVTKNEALHHMVNRVQNNDLDLLVSAVMTSDQVGGNLSDILDTISDTIKDRIRIKQEIRVLTAQGRMSGIIIGLLPMFIILLLMIMNPDYFMSFFEAPIGKIMLCVSISMEIIGFIIINKIVNIEY